MATQHLCINKHSVIALYHVCPCLCRNVRCLNIGIAVIICKTIVNGIMLMCGALAREAMHRHHFVMLPTLSSSFDSCVTKKQNVY